MLNQLTHDSFSPLLGQVFRLVVPEGEPLDAELVEVVRGPGADGEPDDGRRTFSILFRVAGADYLPQSIYRLQHAEMGDLDLFLVPVSQDEEALYHEAVFN